MDVGFFIVASMLEPFKEAPRFGLAVTGYCVYGIIAGAISLFILPQHITPNVAIRFLNILFTPALVGLAAIPVNSCFSRTRIARGNSETFILAYVFTFVLSAVRFVLAK